MRFFQTYKKATAQFSRGHPSSPSKGGPSLQCHFHAPNEQGLRMCNRDGRGSSYALGFLARLCMLWQVQAKILGGRLWHVHPWPCNWKPSNHKGRVKFVGTAWVSHPAPIHCHGLGEEEPPFYGPDYVDPIRAGNSRRKIIRLLNEPRLGDGSYARGQVWFVVGGTLASSVRKKPSSVQSPACKWPALFCPLCVITAIPRYSCQWRVIAFAVF